MQPYQSKYIDNLREIIALSDLYKDTDEDRAARLGDRREALLRLRVLKNENTALLRDHLFPLLDALYSASEEDIASLTEFASALMDWNTNLDTGVYVAIHDALLSYARTKGDRSGIIRELYLLGMGLYYENRKVQGIDEKYSASFYFENEMVFTEAGSYLKHFADIPDDETCGYIVRALANIAICSTDLRRRVAISSRTLKIVQDPYYRSLAPSLPWDVFLKRTHQQMSSNRAVLSKGNLSPEELSAVLFSCQVVFTPEKDTDTPNIRWLWPYYEMEYTCGFVPLEMTLNRMEKLIERTDAKEHDISGLYGNIQLPIYYGRLLKDNPGMPRINWRISFYQRALRKMLETLMHFPVTEVTDFFIYNLILVITDFYEVPGALTYRELTELLMKRFSGRIYLRSKVTGDVLAILIRAICEADPDFFRGMPLPTLPPEGAAQNTSHALLQENSAEAPAPVYDTKNENTLTALLDFARSCALYHDFGLIKMNMDRADSSRPLFEREARIRELHTVTGSMDLAARPSTAAFADAAAGHHRWYSGAGGYPASYVRQDSPTRQVTDVLALSVYLVEKSEEGDPSPIEKALAQPRGRFAPPALAALADPGVRESIQTLLASL